MSFSDIEEKHVLAAVAEHDAIGREAFIKKYGFRHARRYWLVHEGKQYDSKAILGVAHGYARPDYGPLKAKEFVGGYKSVRHKLSSLGFTVIIGQQLGGAASIHLGDLFIVGKSYRRSADIHAQFGGQQQGGICTPKNIPSVIIFTGLSGERHGYGDVHQSDGVIRYFGEGQIGDMAFIKGNKAIRDHVQNGKDLHVFRSGKKGEMVRYLGEFVCADYECVEAPDTNQKVRRAIVFHLVPAAQSYVEPAESENSDKSQPISLAQLRARAISAGGQAQPGKSSDSMRKVYERSKAVRDYVLARADGICEGCKSAAPFKTSRGTPYLEPHHIRRLSDGGPDHPAHVAALCPTCHRRVHHGEGGHALNGRLAVEISQKEAKLDTGLNAKVS